MRPAAAALLLLVAGCYRVDTTPIENVDAGPDATGTGGDAGDEAPRVLSTTPVDLATDAEPDVVITVTFSEPMTSETIDSTTFMVTHDGEVVAGQVSYESEGSIATFQPDARLSLLGEYTATVTSAVTNADGTPLAADHSWTFSVRDGTWGTPTLIETDNAGDANFVGADISVSATGDAIAVWTQSDGVRTNVWANRFVADSGWDVAQLIETENLGNTSSARIATDGGGNGVAVWEQHDGTNQNIWANRFVMDTGWGTAELIEAGIGSASAPEVASDAAGNAVAVWQQSDGSPPSDIRANRFTPGIGWGGTQLVETNDAGNAENAAIAMDAAGNAVAVWSQTENGSRYDAWANRYIPGTGWGTAQLIETGDAGSASFSAIAVDTAGNAIAVWRQSDGTRNNIWANRFVPGTGWGTAQLIETDNAGAATNVKLAVDAAGNALAVWEQSDGTRDSIWANRFIAGTGWAGAQLLETTDDDAGSPDVAFDKAGNAVAVWHQTTGTRRNIWAARFASATGWAAAELIETDDTGNAQYPSVGADPMGNAVAVWVQTNGTRYNVWANTFR